MSSPGPREPEAVWQPSASPKDGAAPTSSEQLRHTPEPFAARMASATEHALFLALARAVGPHGVYVANDLALDPSGRSLAACGLGLYGREGPRGLAWFGVRGNLVVLLADDVGFDRMRVATAIAGAATTWRIALGPEPVLRAVAARLPTPPAILRRQMYYVVDPTLVTAQPRDPRVRVAVPRDLDMLMSASLRLNHSDLAVDPARVSRRWLRQTTRERVRSRTAWVLGPEGTPHAKLDVGSQGPAGAVIEGVFTEPEQRGHGYAAALVHAVASRQLEHGRACVCLHVAENNAPARRCYEKAGLRAAFGVGLLLKA